jgi:hypothetical protein
MPKDGPQDLEVARNPGMSSLDKLNLVDLYYPTDETITALLALPPEQREPKILRILSSASEAEADTHVSRILAILEVFERKT